MELPEDLREWFAACPAALTAFSGGVDSSLTAWLAHQFLGAERHCAVISASPSLKLSEIDTAKQFAFEHGIPLKIIVTREMENEQYLENPVNRCFFCKQTLYTELEEMAGERPGMWVLNGTNTDDLGDYRPGLQAAEAFRVRSPLAECGYDKAGVRALAAAVSLRCWDKPASPCLSSRIPYGQRVTVAKLRRVEAGEAWLIERGFPVCRVRHVEDGARVEVPPEQVGRVRSMEANLVRTFKELGFAEVEIDPEGFVSGKLNRGVACSSARSSELEASS